MFGLRRSHRLPALVLMLVMWLPAVLPARVGDTADPTAAAITQLRHEVGARRLVLLGEMHGTREIPGFIGQLAAAYSVDGPVLLGLEIDQAQNVALATYLASDGGPTARKSLRAQSYWQVDAAKNDGRRSQDMLDLIETVRLLRHQGRDIAVLAYDSATVGGSQQRDRAMADSLRSAFAALLHGRLLVLTGNVHAMLERPLSAPPEMQTPMGSYLRDLDPLSVNITANGGQFWACRSGCGPTSMASFQQVSGPITDGPWQFQVVLPNFTVARLSK